MTIIENFYNCIRYSIRDVVIFPGKNLKNVMFVCYGLFVLNLILTLLKLPVLLNCIGALCASVFITIICFVERRENNEFN